MPKNVVKPINSNKNNLNSEIIFIYHLNPNAHLINWKQRINEGNCEKSRYKDI